jgi:amidohydrolase
MHANGPSEFILRQIVQEISPDIVNLRRDFHRHPELSNREERTAQIVARRLRALGIEVQEKIAHHGVVGILRGAEPGPTVALRADMDALPITETRDTPYRSQTPGVMHACGHDVHTAIGLGAAETLARLRDSFAGCVKFLFQPAEEGPPPGEEGGAKMMIAEGALRNPSPEAVFGLHCYPALEVGCLGYNETVMLSSCDRFTITIRGKKVHGAYPHQGTDAIVVAAAVVTTLQSIRSRMIDAQQPMVLSVGGMNGGNRHNIIADEVILIGTVRALDEEVRARTESLICQVVNGVVGGNGADCEICYERLVPPTVNDAALVERMLPSLRRVVGDSNVVRHAPRMGAEDFAYFAREIPGFFYSLGVANRRLGVGGGIHTPEFDVDEACIPIGVEAMSALVLDYLGARRRPSA